MAAINTSNSGSELGSEEQISLLYDQALAKIQVGDAAQALDDLTAALRLSYAANQPKLLGRVLAAMGETYLSLEQRERAEDCFASALRMDTTSSPEVRLAANSGLARVARQRGEVTQALAYYADAAKVARELQQQAVEAALLNDLGELQVQAGQAKEAQASYARAVEVARASGFADAEAAAYCGMAITSLQPQNLDTAALRVNQALMALRRVENRLTIRTINEKLVKVMEALGLSRRQINLEFALVSAYSEGGIEQAMNTHAEIAQILAQQDEMDKAVAHLDAARKHAQQLKNRQAEAHIVSTLADIYEAHGLSYMALSIYEEWLKTVRNSGDLESELHALEGLAAAHERVGQLDSAIETFQRTLILAQTKCDRQMEARYLYAQALLHLKKHSTETALQVLERAKKVLPANIDPALASEIDRILAELSPPSMGGLSRRMMKS